MKQDSIVLMQPFLNNAETQSSLASKVLSSMVHDDISLVVRRDKLILEFGTSLLMKVGGEKHEYISQRLRQLARLVLALRKLGEGTNLSDFLIPERFDLVVKAVMNISQMSKWPV